VHVQLSLSPMCQSCARCLCQDAGAVARLLGAGRIFVVDERGGAGETQRDREDRDPGFAGTNRRG